MSAATQLLMHEHDRSKLPAAQILAFLAQRPEYQAKVSDLALGALLDNLKMPGPGWGQNRQTQLHCALAVRALIENIQVGAGVGRRGVWARIGFTVRQPSCVGARREGESVCVHVSRRRGHYLVDAGLVFALGTMYQCMLWAACIREWVAYANVPSTLLYSPLAG